MRDPRRPRRNMNGLFLRATKVHLRTMGADLKEVTSVELPDGHRQEVVVFRRNRPLVISQVTLVGTIVVHELAFLSDRLLRYVGVHERARRRQWYGYLLYPFGLAVLIEVLGLLVIAIGMLVFAGVLAKPYYLVWFGAAVAAIPVFLGLTCAFSWLLEMKADWQAINALGISAVAGAKEEARDLLQMRPSLLSRALNRMARPPESFVYSTYRRFHRRTVDMTRI